MSTRVKVAVRLRPMNQRELKIGGDCIVKIKNNRTEVIHPKRRDVKPKVFTFDNCFWSCDNSQHFVDQSEVFESIGTEVVQHSFDGFNSCIFAYGQTGSGKSYTMMGSKSDIGLIPRVANELITTFENMNCKTNRIVLELSYMEIYNEKVKDLLNPQSPSNANIYLKVRENKSYGTYVDGLSKLVVNSYDEIEKHISFGSLSRSVAQTNMNNESSRSHAVLTIYVTQIAFDSETKTKSEKISKLSLVDLAGSERAEKTGAKGDRLREGSNINKSLTTLGLVISALADAKKKNNFVPYRDSVLTWLLKDNLGGNSKTIMMATISPSGDNYEETLSTLRYANSAKNITNLAVINEDPTTALIRELREELDRLRLVVANKSVNSQSITSLSTLNDTIDANERLMKDISKTYDEKLEETAKIDSCRLNSLREIGVTIEKQGITVKKNTFYLINLSSDPSLDLMLVYYLNKDTTVIGNGTSDHVDINISGTGISSIHAILNIDDINEKIFLTVKSNARTFVNSQNVLKETELFNGDHILFGYRHVFRLHTPYANGKNILENIETNEYESVIKEATIGNSPLKRRESFTRMIENMEVKHLADKSDALMQQKECFEDQMEKMRNLLKSKDLQSQLALNKISSDEFTTTLSSNEDVYTRTSTDLNSYFDKTKYEEPQYDNREKQLNRLFNYLKETVYIAETLSEECNAIMREYDIDCVCYPTLTIPPENLCANRSQNILISDGAIEVVYKFLVRIYTIDNFENKFLILRDVYNENKLISNDLQSEMNELVIEIFELNTSQFLGMGNMYLVALLYDLPFMYHVPVINEEGEIIGKIEIGIGRRIVDNIDSCFYEDSSTEMEDGIENKLHNGMSVEISISISEIFDVIPHKHNYLSIKYQFWDIKSDEFIEALPNKTGSKFYINNNQKFQISVTDEFLEYLSECAMSIAVYGKNSADNTKIDSNCNINAGLIEDKLKVLNEQWVEISKKMDVKMEIFEITSNNIYEHVEMEYDKCIESGGLFNLNLGASQHIKVTVNVAEDDKSSLPLIINDIETAMIGSICIKNVNETQLDSYQDIDLKIIHQKWTDALDHKREILESDLDLLSKLEDKTKMQNLEESKLVEQWVSLTSEKQAVLSPIDGSCIPGAKLSLKNVKQGCEKRMPVLFMDLTAKNIKCYSDQEIKSECGFNCIINRESDSAYIKLPKIYFFKDKPDNHWASFSWDKSLHQLAEFNKVTPKEEYLTGVVKIIVNLSYPSSVKIMLRKRICFSIVKKASSFFSLFTKKNPKPHGCNVTYNLVSKLPSIVDNAEHLSNLAKKAMSLKGCDDNTQNMPNSHFEKYMLRINSIDYMIKLDKLRQQYVLHNIMKTRDINVSSYLMKSARKRGTSIKAKNHSKKLNSKNSKLFDTSVSLSTSTINLDKIMRKNKNLERLLSVKSKRNTLSSMASLSNEDLFCDKGDANIADVNKNGSDPNIYSTEEPNQETNFEKEYPSTSWSSDKTLIKDSNDFTEDDVSKKSTESINNHVNRLDTIKEDIEKCDSILNDYDEINNFDEIKVSDDNNTDKHINISLEKQNETPSVEIKNKLPIQSIIETDVNENRLIELKQDFDLENSLNANKNKPLFPSTSTIESEMENNKINDNKNDLNYIESTKLNNQNLDFQDERKFSNLSNVSNLTGSGNNLSCNQLDCFRKFSDTKSQLDCIWNMNLKINDAKSNDSSSNISLTNIDDIFELIESEKDIMRIKAKRKSGIQKDSINSADTIKNEITIADNEGCHYKTKDYEKQKKKENLNEKDKIKSKRDKNSLDEQQHINNSKTNKNIILRNLNRSKPIMRRIKTGRNDLISKELKSSIRDSVLISDSENKNRSSIVTFDMSHLDDQMGTSLEGDNPSKNRRNNKVSETYCSNDEVNKIKPKVCQVSPIDVISRQRLSSSDSNLFNERLISTESTESKQSNKTNPSNIFKIKRLSIKLNRKTNEIKEFELQTDSNNIKDINTPEKFTNDNIDIGTALDNTNMEDHDEKNKLKEVQDVKNIKDIQDINDIQEVNKIEVVNDIEEIQNVDEMIKINQITELKEIESLTSSVSCTDKIIAIEKENELEQLKIQIPKKSNLSNSNESLSSTHTFVMENKDSIENEISTTKETKQKRIKSLKLSSKKSYVVKNSKILTNENTSTEKKSRPTSLYHQSLDKRKSIVNKEKDKDSKSNNLREIKARRKKGKINQNNSHLSLSEKNDSFDLNIKPKSIKKRNTNTVSKISKNRNRISFVSVDRLDKKKILAHGGSDDDSRNTFDIDASSNLGFKRDSYNSLNSEIYQNNDLQYNSDQIDSYASNGTDSPDKCVLSHWMKISSAVHVKSKENEMLKGRIRFIGDTEFASGLWIGVEITHGRGKHDGTVNGKIYFKCRKNKGIFVRPNRLLPDHSESMYSSK